MSNWSTLGVPRGSYTSSPFFVSNDLDRYVATITNLVVNPFEQTVRYYFRTTYNQSTWSDWKEFYTTSFDLLDEYNLKGLYIQIRIVIVSENDYKKPYIQSLNMELRPFSYIDNTGDMTIKPKIWIRKKNGDGNISIVNSTTGQIVEFKNLMNNEEIYIDCENEEIVSSFEKQGIYRYDSHNDEFLELTRGVNYLTSIGDFDLDIRHKGILLQD